MAITFGVSLQTSTRCIAALHMILAVLAIVAHLTILALSLMGHDALDRAMEDLYRKEPKKYPREAIMGIVNFVQHLCFSSTMFAGLKLILSMKLWHGAKKHDGEICKLWYHVYLMMWIGALLFDIAMFAVTKHVILGNITEPIFLVFEAYFLWIVHDFVHEIGASH